MTPNLTAAQLQTLKNHIAASSDLNTFPNNDDGNESIANLLNLAASPAFVAYKTSVSTSDVGRAVNYIAVESMTDANRGRINTFYYMNPESFDPSRSDVRTYWDNTFSGALGGQGQATRDALAALWKRAVTRVERLYCTGTGSDAAPGTLGPQDKVTRQEVNSARNLP